MMDEAFRGVHHVVSPSFEDADVSAVGRAPDSQTRSIAKRGRSSEDIRHSPPLVFFQKSIESFGNILRNFLER